MTFRQRLSGLAACFALGFLLIGIPALLIAIKVVPDPGAFATDRLTAPDDGTLALAVIGIVAWIVWLVLAMVVGLEVLARLGRTPVPRVPGLGMAHGAAGRLVAIASLAFVATTTTTSVPGPVPEAVWEPTTAVASTAQAPTPPPHESDRPPAHPEQETTEYTVKRGDSLWSIAETHLGDGRRYGEIVDLNPSSLASGPDFITPGTTLQIPATEPSRLIEDLRTHVVAPGETLSEIAQKHLGSPQGVSQIFEASRSTVQPDGERLKDPDLLRPGWELTIPVRSDSPFKKVRPTNGDGPGGREITDPSRTRTSPIGPEDDDNSAERSVVRSETADADDQETPTWLIPGLAGAGAILAAAVLLTLRAHGRTRFRLRRPGEVIGAIPSELVPAQKSASFAGGNYAPPLEAVDQGLRSLARDVAVLPPLRLIRIGPTRVTAEFATDTCLPAPWTGHGEIWSADPGDLGTAAPDDLAPFPLLVSVGQSDDGSMILLNLELLGAVRLVGAPDRCAALARHLVAELALQPWSSLVEIDTFGICGELSGITPSRHHHHSVIDATETLARVATELRDEPDSEVPDRFRAVVFVGDAQDEIDIVQQIVGSRRRSGAVSVQVGEASGADPTVVQVSSDGHLAAQCLPHGIRSAGLSSVEAQLCADLVEAAATTQPKASTWRRQPATRDRPQEESEPAGENSLLPATANEYVAAAATTVEDVASLAPVVTDATRLTAFTGDPDLDQDLREWFDPDSAAPKLTLLGPVDARATGNPKAVSARKPYYVELLAFLSLHPEGLTARDVSDAMGIGLSRARTDISLVRSWLGTNPRTRALHLPTAQFTRSQPGHGAQRYQVTGVLSDIDLFERLRARAHARGEGGLADLKSALRLVAGEPFTQLRPAGWSWLLEGDRTDHIVTCAIADVTHLVTTRALAEGDIELARQAAETGHRAAPADETATLDLIQVAAASGHAGSAVQQLAEQLLNRSDDGLGPLEVPPRTAAMLTKFLRSSPTSKP